MELVHFLHLHHNMSVESENCLFTQCAKELLEFFSLEIFSLGDSEG